MQTRSTQTNVVLLHLYTLIWNVLFMKIYASWARLPYVLMRNVQFGVYPFRCKVCVHGVHGTVVLLVKILFARCVKSKDKFYTFRTLCLMYRAKRTSCLPQTSPWTLLSPGKSSDSSRYCSSFSRYVLRLRLQISNV